MIMAPSGAMCKPKLMPKKSNTETIIEAQWIDPRTGMLFHKGIVEVIPNKK